MKFSRLIEGADHASAAELASEAAAAGIRRLWLLADERPLRQHEITDALMLPQTELALQLDPATDVELPARFSGEIIVAAEQNWPAALSGLLQRHRLDGRVHCWVRTSSAASAAAAADHGVGLLIPQLKNADAAAEWVSAYERQLSFHSSHALSGRANLATAALLELPGELDAAVGLVERLRQAGVDEVVLCGPASADAGLLAALQADFDDPELRAEAKAKAERLAPMIKGMERRSAPEAVAQGEPRAKREGRVGRLVKRNQKAVVERMSDRQLEATVGSRVGVRVLMTTIASRYRPDRAEGFDGTIEFALRTRKRLEVWSIDCSPAGAKVRRGATSQADLHLESTLADFLRIGTGEIAAPAALLSGELHVRGDFVLALRMGEMFDGPAIV